MRTPLLEPERSPPYNLIFKTVDASINLMKYLASNQHLNFIFILLYYNYWHISLQFDKLIFWSQTFCYIVVSRFKKKDRIIEKQRKEKKVVG